MKRYIPQFVRGGFPELYAVLDSHEGWQVSEPMPYHAANDQAEARNNGTWGQVQTNVDWSPITGWLGGPNYALGTPPVKS